MLQPVSDPLTASTQAAAPALAHGTGTVLTLLEQAWRQHRHQAACVYMARTLTHGQIDDLSRALAAHLLAQGLVRGDRVAVMLPNVPQLLVTVAALLRAGLVVVNIAPQLPLREMALQLKDSAARAVVLMETEAHLLQQLPATLPERHHVVASLGDLLGPMKGALVNHWMRRVRRLVPTHQLPHSVSFADAIDDGRQRALPPPVVQPEDIAALQYSAGTTGQSKGAVLLHRNLAANILQARAWMEPALQRCPSGQQWVTVGALPLNHIFGFTLVMLLGMHLGSCILLIPNADDTGGMLKVLARHRFHAFPAVDSLFQALAHHPEVDAVDWSHLRLSLGGATAVQPSTALLWLLKTGSPICQGYGLSEASPAVTCNPTDDSPFSGHLGQPLPGTEVRLIDDEGLPVPAGTPGEIAVRGPQVMAGYWQRPDETARVMTADGFLRTGDIGVQDAHGALRLVDRKKDLIFVSGFNVYPNEVEDVVAQIPGVRACAAVAAPDQRTGEVVKLILVKTDPGSASPTEAEVRAWCDTHLTGYKRPRVVEFRPELPRSAVGKVLRRELRDGAV
jgi:long-chain acyl-CoA synthetase